VAAQCAGAGPELGAHHVIELADAAKPGRKGYVAKPPVGLIHEHPGGARPTGPVDLMDGRAHLLPEDPVQVPHTDPKLLAQPRHPEVVEHSVANGPHRPAHQVLPVVPADITGQTIRSAPPARPETGRHRGGCAGEETTVLAPR
jgi:hypothetical protein